MSSFNALCTTVLILLYIKKDIPFFFFPHWTYDYLKAWWFLKYVYCLELKYKVKEAAETSGKRAGSGPERGWLRPGSWHTFILSFRFLKIRSCFLTSTISEFTGSWELPSEPHRHTVLTPTGQSSDRPQKQADKVAGRGCYVTWATCRD